MATLTKADEESAYAQWKAERFNEFFQDTYSIKREAIVQASLTGEQLMPSNPLQQLATSKRPVPAIELPEAPKKAERLASSWFRFFSKSEKPQIPAQQDQLTNKKPQK